jgi:hypothetical protein
VLIGDGTWPAKSITASRGVHARKTKTTSSRTFFKAVNGMVILVGLCWAGVVGLLLGPKLLGY